MDIQSLVIGSISLIFGAPLALWPRQRRQATIEEHEARPDEIEASGEEQYCEEPRAILADPPARPDRRRRIKGIILAVMGGLLIIRGIFG